MNKFKKGDRVVLNATACEFGVAARIGAGTVMTQQRTVDTVAVRFDGFSQTHHYHESFLDLYDEKPAPSGPSK
jgi:hypothetical protein